jgi:hypothetical protein
MWTSCRAFQKSLIVYIVKKEDWDLFDMWCPFKIDKLIDLIYMETRKNCASTSPQSRLSPPDSGPSHAPTARSNLLPCLRDDMQLLMRSGHGFHMLWPPHCRDPELSVRDLAKAWSSRSKKLIKMPRLWDVISRLLLFE